MDSEIIKTADGSHTLFVKSLNEQYHSVNGAITESMHVFIKNALLFSDKKEITVFEAGFGTGLNCLLTAEKAKEEKIKVYYISVEKYPLEEGIIKKLNYPSVLGGQTTKTWDEIHKAGWGEEVPVSDNFTLLKINADLTALSFATPLPPFDVIYFDAFAPGVQPEMWQPSIFNFLYNKCNPKAVITTYSSKGQVRRTMALAGFSMEKLPGPPGKKEMLRGIKGK